MSYLSVAPFGQSVPRLIGLSGSPSTCTTVGVTFFALSPRVWMITPHATAQYGQILRVSVVRAFLNYRISARARDTSNPIPAAAPATTAPFKNVRRFIEPPCPFGPSRPTCPVQGPCRSGMRLHWSLPSPTYCAANAAQFFDMAVDKRSTDSFDGRTSERHRRTRSTFRARKRDLTCSRSRQLSWGDQLERSNGRA